MSEKTAIEMGLECTMRLIRLECARWKAEAFKYQRDYASARHEIARLEVLLAERCNTTGEEQMPLNSEAAKRFFERKKQ